MDLLLPEENILCHRKTQATNNEDIEETENQKGLEAKFSKTLFEATYVIMKET